jgi:hypothetical protein
LVTTDHMVRDRIPWSIRRQEREGPDTGLVEQIYLSEMDKRRAGRVRVETEGTYRG